MTNSIIWDLQILADGGAAGGQGGGGAAGVNGQGAAGSAITGEGEQGAADLAEMLAERGVPQALIEKRRTILERKDAEAKRGRRVQSAQVTQSDAQGAGGTPPHQSAMPTASHQGEAERGEGLSAQGEDTEEVKDAGQSTGRMTFEEIQKDPEYAQQLKEYTSNIVRQRLGEKRQAEEQLRTLAPAIETLAKYYEMGENPDLGALAKKIEDDSAYYVDRAIQENKSVDEVRQKDAEGRRQRDLREQAIQQHFMQLRQQEAAMKQSYPAFDLATELRNPVFARMVGPGSLVSLEDAYFVVHRQEILKAQQEAAQKAAMEAAARSIQAGQNRPQENGTAGRSSPSGPVMMTREQHEDLKRRIHAAAARGEKIYPT